MANKEDVNMDIYSFSGKSIPKEYINVVRSRWIRSYKKQNDFMRLVHPPAYYFAYTNYVNMILQRKDTIVLVAVLEDDPDVVLGFSVTERNILHYVHVPTPYRRRKIATMLVPETIEWTTHLTKIGMRIWATKGHKIRFSPFI